MAVFAMQSPTAMGNWASRDIDLDGSGIDFAEDNLDPDLATHFNNANQWDRRNVTTGGSPVSPDTGDGGPGQRHGPVASPMAVDPRPLAH